MTAGICSGSESLPATNALVVRTVAALAFCAVLSLQGYLALQLFGRDDPLAALLHDEPVINGRHPLHYYQAALGTQTWKRAHGFVCFDPTFQAGYPKTPVFDGGCRPTELGVLLCHADMEPRIYKVGIWLWSTVLPACFWFAAAALGFSRWTRFLAFGLGILLWWNEPCRRLLETGDMNGQALGVLIVLHLCVLARCHARPGLLGWLGLLATTAGGWYLNPMVWVGVSLLGIGFWLGVGRKHRFAWHFGLLAAQALAAALASRWVMDWMRYWWIYVPIRAPLSAISNRDWSTLWNSPNWTITPVERVAYALILMTGLIGTVGLVAGRRRCASVWLFLAAGGVLVFAVAGQIWAPLRQFDNDQFVFVAVCLAVIPAARACTTFIGWLFKSPRRRWGTFALVAPSVGAIALNLAHRELPAGLTTWGPRPFEIGRPHVADAFVAWAREHTTPKARIVWEDLASSVNECWTVLLADWCDRPFLGALDASADLEHGFMTLKDGVLAGRPIAMWTDDELEAYCQRYNVGWFACATDSARERLARFRLAEPLPTPTGWETRSFFSIRRPLGFVLQGSARELSLEPQRIVLNDVVPENGTVLLSLHFQQGWRVRPGWVKVEREPDPFDPIPFLRLRMPGPVARITLTWEGR